MSDGRDWEVPLMTEPGIDINWKARYDFFKMVDGIELKPADIVNGEFKGKLKKDEYLHGGRKHQMVPDFLKQYIRRSSDAEQVLVVAASAAGPSAADQNVDTLNGISENGISEATFELLPSDAAPDLTNREPPTVEGMPDPGRRECKETPDHVLRWTLRAVPSKWTMRKLHAVCILAEGNTPLRIVNQKGEVLVGETENICVNENEFNVLTRMLGIG
jgi:hypothetical protein